MTTTQFCSQTFSHIPIWAHEDNQGTITFIISYEYTARIITCGPIKTIKGTITFIIHQSKAADGQQGAWSKDDNNKAYTNYHLI